MKQPPKYFLRFLRWFCDPEYVDYIEGDLIELFEDNIETKGSSKAAWIFRLDVLRLFRPSLLKALSNRATMNYSLMIKHNFILSIRSFRRYKSSFLINLVGLSSGLACALMIYLWVNHELNVNKFHPNDGQLYQVMTHSTFVDQIETRGYTPGPLAEALVNEFPEVELAATVNNTQFTPTGIISTEDKSKEPLPISGRFASKNYFSFFNYELADGSYDQMIVDNNSIAISTDLALKLFGTTEQLIGQSVTWNNRFFDKTFFISGVYEPLPDQASEHFDAVISYDIMVEWDQWAGHWSGGYANTFVQLVNNTDIEAFNEKIAHLRETKIPNWEFGTFFVQKFSDRYLYNVYENGVQSGGRILYVQLFSLVGLFILIIACINFINLSTAQATRKMKEVGIKKALGVHRKVLAWRFFQESLLITLLSMMVALVLVTLLLPQFNIITGKQMVLRIDSELFITISGIALLTGILSGSYPALYLSGFNPITILKGNITASSTKAYLKEAFIRKGLVIFQFALSVIFIISVFVVNQQIEYAQTKNMGYSRDNVLTFKRPEGFRNHSEAFLSQLNNTQGVVDVSNMYFDLLNHIDSNGSFIWEGQEDGYYTFKAPRVGYNFITTMDMELVAGRDYSRDYSNESNAIILNQASVELMNLKEPVVGTLLPHTNGENYEIIGVVKDFHYGSLHNRIDPLFFRFREGGDRIMVRIQAGSEREAIADITDLYKSFYPGFPFSFSFMDDEYQRLYEAESRVATLSTYFMGLTILISCLGLFGLAAFAAERKTKEIGIRKVLGASTLSIINMLTSDFAKTVCIAIMIALPVGYIITDRWLSGFAYQTDIHWMYFVGAGIIALVVACATVILQTIKAAYVNPVTCLRSE